MVLVLGSKSDENKEILTIRESVDPNREKKIYIYRYKFISNVLQFITN